MIRQLTPTQEATLRHMATGDLDEMGTRKSTEATYQALRKLGLLSRSESFPYHVATPGGYRWLAAADRAADVTEYAARQRVQRYRLWGPLVIEAYDYETQMYRALAPLGEFATLPQALDVIEGDFNRVVQAALAVDPTFTVGDARVVNRLGNRVWSESDEALRAELVEAMRPVLPLDTPDTDPLASQSIAMVEWNLKGGEHRPPTPKEIEMTGITNRNTKALKPCACSLFQVEKRTDIADGDLVRTGCTRQTNRQFAQGHDAKLVSFLVAADIEGRLMMVDGLAENFGSADEILRATFGEALAAKAQRAIVNALDKAARAKTPKAAKAAAPREVAVTVVEPTPVEAPTQLGKYTVEPDIKGKVGRWIYEGHENSDGTFSYVVASGEQKLAQVGKWTKVA